MIKSMTGYARTESTIEGKKLVVEMKSLNHRNLESNVRIPFFLAALEMDIKKRIGERISRGKIEISVRIDSDSGAEGMDTLEANLPLIDRYYSLITDLKKRFGLRDEIRLDTLVAMKGSIYVAEVEIDPGEAWDIISTALNDSINSLIHMKEVEGGRIYEDFIDRIDTVSAHIKELESRIPRVADDYKERLSERIRELTDGMECDESRLIQEIAIMAEKSDITEEIVRLKSHIKQFGEMLNSDAAIGRKMDFLFQEMHREINTIGSKSNDLEISSHVIEIKAELAKMREQVQNIE